MSRPSTDAIPKPVVDALDPDPAPTLVDAVPNPRRRMAAEPARTRPMLPAAIARLLANPAARPLASDVATTRELPIDADDAARTLGALARAADRAGARQRVTIALPGADGVPSEIAQRPRVALPPPGDLAVEPSEAIRTLVYAKRQLVMPLVAAPSASHPMPQAVPIVHALAVGSLPPGVRNAIRPRSPSPWAAPATRPLSPSFADSPPAVIAGSAGAVQQFGAASADALALAAERAAAERATTEARVRVLVMALACLLTLLVGGCVLALVWR